MANILIADDDPGVVEVMAKILEKAGHVVSKSGSGAETFQALGIRPLDETAFLPDLIILDIMMPRSDGYTVGTMIRNNPRTRDIPILVVSALRELSRLFTATVPVQGFLTKPFVPQELLDRIAQILASRQASRA
ncbi:MAG TPA: hypothetical protein DEB40_09085 [Elusimicrobia bacterium]|nr:hypothetical protein [Elusimicrobiota bacterium]HBT61882.1 hypothetical protein [Elusimicrobiota bacterium]